MSRETVIVNEPLHELSSSGFEMANDEPDIRGWKVFTDANQHIGKVKELLFDVNAQKIRYLIVDLDGKPLNLLSRDVIIPIGLAELDEKENVVYLPDITVGHLATLPEYKKGKVTYETERAVRDVFIPQNSTAAEKLADFESKEHPEREAFYKTSYFDENRLYKRRANEHQQEKIIRKNEPQEPRIIKGNNVKEDVAYIPDENDPTVLRKVKIVRDVRDDN
ncbi:MAG: PRC-barrel domain-containing protein [Ginsengibacter sp.]